MRLTPAAAPTPPHPRTRMLPHDPTPQQSTHLLTPRRAPLDSAPHHAHTAHRPLPHSAFAPPPLLHSPPSPRPCPATRGQSSVCTLSSRTPCAHPPDAVSGSEPPRQCLPHTRLASPCEDCLHRGPRHRASAASSRSREERLPRRQGGASASTWAWGGEGAGGARGGRREAVVSSLKLTESDEGYHVTFAVVNCQLSAMNVFFETRPVDSAHHRLEKTMYLVMGEADEVATDAPRLHYRAIAMMGVPIHERSCKYSPVLGLLSHGRIFCGALPRGMWVQLIGTPGWVRTHDVHRNELVQPVGVRDSIENAAKESRKGACIERQLTIPLDADTDRATITRSDIYLHLLIPRGNAPLMLPSRARIAADAKVTKLIPLGSARSDGSSRNTGSSTTTSSSDSATGHSIGSDDNDDKDSASFHSRSASNDVDDNLRNQMDGLGDGALMEGQEEAARVDGGLPKCVAPNLSSAAGQREYGIAGKMYDDWI